MGARLNPIHTLLSDLQPLAQQMRDLYRQAIAQANAEVNDILQTDDRDSARIERQLDHMLGFCCDPDMLLVFKRLCRHYFTFAPVATAEYIQAYREMWDTPEEEETQSPVRDGRPTGNADLADVGRAGV